MKQRNSSIVLIFLLIHHSSYTMEFLKEYFQGAKEFLYQTTTEQKLLISCCSFLGTYLVFNEWRHYKKNKRIEQLENNAITNNKEQKKIIQEQNQEIKRLKIVADNFSWTLMGLPTRELPPTCDIASIHQLFNKIRNSLGVTSLAERIGRLEREITPNLEDRISKIEIQSVPNLAARVSNIEDISMPNLTVKIACIIEEFNKKIKETTDIQHSLFLMQQKFEGEIRQFNSEIQHIIEQVDNFNEALFFHDPRKDNTPSRQEIIKGLRKQAKNKLNEGHRYRLEVLEQTFFGKDYKYDRIPLKTIEREGFLHEKRKLVRDQLRVKTNAVKAVDTEEKAN